MIKDQQYWKDYNQKRREYFRQRYLQQKGVVKPEAVVKTNPSQVVNKPKILQPKPSSDILQPSLQPNLEVVKSQAKILQPHLTSNILQPKLWSNYYHGKKPFCSGCRQKNIPSTAYAFCSLARDIDFDFKNVYVCQVYHWTIYQGQGKT